MPLIKPKKSEKQSDFIERCMGNKTMNSEYPDQKQRSAVCYTQWKNKDKKSKSAFDPAEMIVQAEYLGYSEGTVKDTLIVKFKLCHANKNANYDIFTKEELRKSYYTAVGKAIDMGHDKTYTIGYISDAVFVDTQEDKIYYYKENKEQIEESDDLYSYGYKIGEDSYVYCEGVIWKKRYEAEAEEIRDDFESGKLFFSMETYFEKCRCETCGVLAIGEDEYCTHLENRFQLGTGRILIECTFAGVGKVEHPADKDAVGLAAAKNDGFNLIDLIPDEKFDKKMLKMLVDIKLGR